MTAAKVLKIFSLFVFVILCLLVVKVQAQTSEETSGVSISPVTFELNSDPGDTLTNQVKIYNPTDFEQGIKMDVEDFTPVGEEGQVVLQEPEENSTYSLAGWTSLSPEEFTLKARSQQIVTFVIKVPQNGEPGGHYGSIVASVSGGTIEATGTTLTTKRGALLLLRVSGQMQEELIVNTFSTKLFQEYGPVNFDLKFENTGNVHVRPAGFITITDQFGKQVAQLEISQNNVIPQAIRQAGTTWDSKNLMGRYTATLVANYGSTSKQTITAVSSFTVFPWKKGVIVGAILLVVIFILLKSRKRLARAFRVLVGKQ